MDQAAASAAPATQAAPGNLRANALGLPSVLFCIVTGAAPLAAMIFNVPVAVLGGGYAAPAAFLIATIALTIFSVGYIEMSRRVTSAGGFYAFITRGLGSIMGLGSGVWRRASTPGPASTCRPGSTWPSAWRSWPRWRSSTSS
jgi:amino acid transporter